jgi:hypothetical protein
VSTFRLPSRRRRKRRSIPLNRRIALAEEKRQEAWAALNVIRRAVEELGVGLVQFDETAGPERTTMPRRSSPVFKLHDRMAGGAPNSTERPIFRPLTA